MRAMSPREDVRWMRRALALAARGLGETNPNPVVGCVVVRGGRVVGEGFHARAGGPHAEVVALERAGARSRGATLYVTLEPCAHFGRTPPCAPLARGQSKWITSPAQRAQARWLRRLHDGVLVGIGTVLADDPLLLPSPRPRRPFASVVHESRLRLPPTSRLARSAGPQAPVLVLTTSRDPGRRRRLEREGVEVRVIPGGPGRVSPRRALESLWARGARSLMVEGGSEVLGSFLAARLF